VSLDVVQPGARAGEAARLPRATRWILLGSVPLVVAYYTVQMRALAGDALRGDLGIQYTLARLTAEGAVPLVDFEHGWNAGAWYFSALLYRLAGAEPTLWTFLWGRAAGFVLAGLAMLAIAWRLRLEPWWAAALVPLWMLVTHVPNNKYAVPLAWLLVLLPVAATRGTARAVVLRAGIVATVWWFHVELAVLLGAGTAMYDLFGARDVAPRDRLLRAGAVGAGLAAGALSQIAVYAALGLAPADLLAQLLFGQAETVEANFAYPLGAPSTFRTLVYPATLLLPFVPAVWRRLTSPTRLVAFLHLSQALVAIRRTDDNHIAAAATLLALLVVLVVRDLLRSRELPALAPLAWPAAFGGALAGAAWVGVALLAGFRVPSRLALVGLVLACLAAVAAARGGDRPWGSAGAVGAITLVLAAGLAGHVRTQVSASDADARAEAIAAAVAPDVERCLAGDRRAWVVADPLTLYDHLDLRNPTPFYLFWYTFEHETERVTAMLEAGAIPAIVQVGAWPASMRDMVPAVEAALQPCAAVEATGDVVTIWTR
jgi:hypothetical protein